MYFIITTVLLCNNLCYTNTYDQMSLNKVRITWEVDVLIIIDTCDRALSFLIFEYIELI